MTPRPLLFGRAEGGPYDMPVYSCVCEPTRHMVRRRAARKIHQACREIYDGLGVHGLAAQDFVLRLVQLERVRDGVIGGRNT